MYLESLTLRHFRNYSEQQVSFTAAKTIVLGDNAQGKSNLIEAVEILSALKSHRTSRDRELIQSTETSAQIIGNLDRLATGNIELSITLRANGRRTVALNGLAQRRQLDFLGKLNMVQFSSLDLDLVRGGPDCRRTWIDGLLIQLEPIYAHILQQYNQILRQRNARIKTIKAAQQDGRSIAIDDLALWDAQLAVAGSRVIRRRDRVIQRLLPFAKHWHEAISGKVEQLEITYRPNVAIPNVAIEADANASSPEAIQSAFLDQIREKRTIELYQGTSLVGPHRDDIEFTVNETAARQYGSQGQQRTLVLALKLAELKLIEDVIGEPPILLLDDVLAELDLHRQNQLLDAIQDRFQTLITTTHLGSFDAQWLNSAQILHINSGQLTA
jgi:DNA replication and repair protein RecF